MPLTFRKTPTLRVVAGGATSVTLYWDAVPDATSYRIYRDDALVASPAAGTYPAPETAEDAGLSPETEYSYQVAAVIGTRIGTRSRARTVTTPAGSVTEHTGTGAVALPGLTITGTAVRAILGTGAITLPGLTTSGTGVRGLSASGAITLPSMTVFGSVSGSEVVASSASLADVQTAVNAASDGDKVLIPNGSATWTGGISTTKQIIIRAQNYTPTSMGTMSRNVTITNNSSSGPLLTFSSGDSSHCGVGGIRFDEGTGTSPFIRYQGSGSKVPVMFDCAFSTRTRMGNAESISAIVWVSLGGVCWNTRFDGSAYPESGSDVGNSVTGINIHFKSPRTWPNASTLGSLDSDGNVNVYFEDCTFYMTGTNDIDDHARTVARYCMIDGSWWETHGFTSSWGGRHFEFYENTIQSSLQPRNLAGRYFWSRAGHGVFFNNLVNAAPTGDYSQPSLFTCNIESGTNNMSWDGSSWPKPRQTGCGHNGGAYVSDPIYFWDNTGSRASSISGTSETPGANIGRDLITGTEKPGYSPYTYPHPVRSAVS